MRSETPADPLMVFQDESLKSPGIAHGFFARQGGYSSGIYTSLNCGNGSEDSPKCVSKNQGRVADYLGVASDALLTLYQVHSNETLEVVEPWTGADRPKADAMVTNTPGLALGVLTADCAPVLFANPEAKVIGAAHAGWQGAISGVIENTVKAMNTLGAETQSITAVIGPCIGQLNYQVGPEFRDRFVSADAHYEIFFIPSNDSTRKDHWQFDLKGFVESRLITAGVQAVSTIGLCSYAIPENFFSYRRSTHLKEPDYGRNISAIALGHD